MADHLDCELELTLKHIPFLVEQLSENASVWRELGTALEFRQGDLDNIQSCLPLITKSPHSFLQRLVEEWLGRKHPHTLPPTLASLLKALNSHTVGLGTLATRLKDSLHCHDKYEFAIASVSVGGKVKLNENKDIKVNENMCVNLKIETSKPLSFKWNNTLGIEYPGKEESVLCIPKTDIDILDGNQYSCKIHCYSGRKLEGCKVFTTAPVTLRVSCPELDQLKESLASIYLAHSEVPDDTWPPVSNKTYINLALIKQQQAINYGGEYTRLTVRGGIDDILHHKEKIEYDKIFDGLRSGSLLLIEGRPGSGKTTFVHKITRDWAASEIRGPMRLVLLISLRVLNSWKKPVTLEDILELLNVQVSATVIQKRNGKGVCFIFDGLDEFSPHEGKESIVYKIIDKNYLPQSIVIVASRPAALIKLRRKANKAIEVIGFLKDQIFEYVNHYPFSKSSKADQLKSYFLSHPNILHMCYLPIHTAMIAFLFEVMGEVPRTETEIYKHFTRFTLMRSLTKHNEQDELEDMDTDKLSKEEKELFDTICKFALEKTVQQKQVLDQDEMKMRLHGKGCKDISLGLVTVDRTAGLYGFKNIYTFLHLTFQEYLAAHHVSTLSDEDQYKLIILYGSTDHMQAVWKFYFGLVNFEGHECKINALISGRNEIGLLDIQCAYESQQEIVCSFFVTKMDAQITLEDKYLTTTDFTALGYLLANSSIPASLSLIKCDFSAESANTLLAEIKGKPLMLCALHCKSIKVDIAALVSLLRNSSEPVSLSLIKCDLNAANTAETGGKPLLLRTLFCKSVKMSLSKLNSLLRNSSEPVSLSLIKCDLNAESANAGIRGKPLSLRALHCESTKMRLSELVLLLRNSPEPVSLSLIKCDIQPTDIFSHKPLWLHALDYVSRELSDGNIVQKIMTYQHGIEHLKLSNAILHKTLVSTSLANLKELSLTNVKFEPKTLFSVLDNCEELTSLTLNIIIKDDDFKPLLLGLFDYKRLKKVSYTVTTPCLRLLYEQDTSRQVALELEALPHDDPHKRMRIDNTIFTILTHYVSNFSILEKLILRGIGSDATSLAKTLSHCVMLQELDISYRRTAVPLKSPYFFTALIKCSNLQRLFLTDIFIGLSGALDLSTHLQHWPKLHELCLRGCGIGEEGAEAITDNLKDYPELAEVDVSERNVT